MPTLVISRFPHHLKPLQRCRNLCQLLQPLRLFSLPVGHELREVVVDAVVPRVEDKA